MRTAQRRFGFLAFVAILLVQLACGGNDVTEYMEKMRCEANGGTWVREAPGESWCDHPEAAEPAPTPSQDQRGCIALPETYTWAHENLQSSSGTGGSTCNAVFVFQNNGDETVNLVAFTSWDNNAMHDSGWEVIQVPAGGRWEERVSRTVYKDGVITYSRVDYILVVRDTQNCVDQLDGDDRTKWEPHAVAIHEIPCP